MAYVLLFLWLQVAHKHGHGLIRAVYHVTLLLPYLFASVCALASLRRRKTMPPRQRLGWLLVSLACLSWVGGEAAWSYYELIRQVPGPFPGWPDVGFLTAYPFLIGGVFSLFGSMPLAGRARLVLDSAIASGGAGMLSWYFLVQPLWLHSRQSLFAKCLSVAYPLGDIVVIFGALALWMGAVRHKGVRMMALCLAGGMTLVATGDSAFVFASLHGTNEAVRWANDCWVLGWLLMGYAFLLPLWRRGQEAAQEEGAETAAGTRGCLGIVLPYVTAFGAVSAVGGRDYAEHHFIAGATYLVGLALMLLVISRQLLTLLENQRLAVDLRALNETLEQRVARRTDQLNALNQLSKAVNGARTEETVLDAAAWHVRQALHASALILWDLDGSARTVVCRCEGLPEASPLAAFVRQIPLCQGSVLVPLSGQQVGEEAGALLCAPLCRQQRALGMVGVIRGDGRFETSDYEMLESIGLEVGAALENARRYQEALEAADRDPVTNLLNHRAIHQKLDQALAGAPNQTLSILLMDLINFKLFNDTYGHPVGDEVLRSVARVLRDVCGPDSLVGRYGGDEFLVVAPGRSAAAARALALRLQERLWREGFQRPGDERAIPITLSFGVASFPEDSHNRHELLTLADTNLYAAKLSGTDIISTSETQRANRALRGEGSFDMLDAMINSVDNKDRYTRRHSEDVTEYALWIAEELGVSAEILRRIRIGGLLHDVGKIGVPDEILRKPGRLTDAEFAAMRQHPQLGALIVGAIPGMEDILDAVRSHHERWDGRGYPDGLAGDAIPFLGRVMAVADAVSAMTTDRPYRRGMAWEVALGEIRAHAETQFDPEVAEAFLRAAAKRRPAESDLQAA